MSTLPTICLVVPEDSHTRLYRQVPIDILHAGAGLQSRGYDVYVWDRRVKMEAPRCDPSLIVVTSATSDRAQCYPLDMEPVRIAVACSRQCFPNASVIVYGPHGNYLPEDTLAITKADVIARGEHEGAVIEAVEVFYTKGIANKPVILPSVKESFTSIEPYDLPLPAYDLVDLHEYYAETADDNGMLHQGTTGLILSVRGCPYQCSFCHLPYAFQQY